MSLLYINPVELLDLAGVPVTSIEAATIKKKRKQLLAELELGDGTKAYKGQRLDWSACERACMDLDEPAYLRVWHRLANMPALNNFLGSGHTDFFLNPASAISLLTDTDSLRLVGPRYALQYDQALLAAFQARDVTRFQRVVAAPALYLPSENRQAYQSLSRLLREKLEEVRAQTKAFDDDDNAAQVLASFTKILNSAGWTALLNALPTSYFGGLRTELAMAVRNFAIQFHNTFFEQTPVLKLLQEVATLPLDGQSADRIREDIQQVREIEKKKLAQERADAVAERFGQAFEQLSGFQKQVASGYADMTLIDKWLNGLTNQVSGFNTIADSEAISFRDSLAVGLFNLSIDIWNKNQENGDTAVRLQNCVSSLKISQSTKAKFKDLSQKLIQQNNIRKQNEAAEAKRWRAEQNKNNDTGKGCLIFVAIAIIIGVIIALANAGKSTSSNSSSPPTTTETTAADASIPTEATGNNPPAPTYEPEVSAYAGNQLPNGASPLDNCFGKGRYAGPAWINFKNDNNDTDAIVCLARTSNNKVIRNEYIRAGTSFRMSRIPAGSYYLKVFYGRDWNPTRLSACGTKGYFDTDQRFSESREASDLIRVEANNYSYTTGTMTLYSVAGGNMAQQTIDANEFFRQ